MSSAATVFHEDTTLGSDINQWPINNGSILLCSGCDHLAVLGLQYFKQVPEPRMYRALVSDVSDTIAVLTKDFLHLKRTDFFFESYRKI